ncbi:hypothetical protein [Fibrobacter sp.]|uniref:hypothetical protein n=1 Tax=Fibrobacter sp. TaxID=35828 RepID=UPI0038708FF6
MTDNNNSQDKKKWLDTCGHLISLLLAICGTATAIFAYHASLNANDISRRSFENAELSAQPIISGYLDKDSSLIINIQKEYRGINFVNATPVITLMEGIINDKSLESMKKSVFAYKSKWIGSCHSDEANNIKCDNREFRFFIRKMALLLNNNNVNSDTTEYSFRNLYFAYIFTISYNDIYNKRQTQHFIVSLHGRQHQIPDSLFKEKFTDTEYLTFADANEKGLNKILSKLSQAEDQTIPRKKD